MLKGEKGVTRIVLAVGIIMTIVIVLAIGIYLLSPIIKESEEFMAKDLALYVDTALAAPENIYVEIDLPKSSATKISAAYVSAPHACVGSIGFNKNLAQDCGLFGSAGALTNCLFKVDEKSDEVTISGGPFIKTKIACNPFTSSTATKIEPMLSVRSIKLDKTYDNQNKKNNLKWD